MPEDTVRLFLCGDVMIGRAVDQILPSPGDPTLREGYLKDARDYVRLAEQANGPIPRPVEPSWPWGDVLPALAETEPDVRIVNLETSITRSDDFAPGKAVHYRMSPDNVAALAVAEPDVCTLANNHVVDFGVAGLEETLDVLEAAGLEAVGAGRDRGGARRPAAVPLPGGGRVLVYSVGLTTSGIPADWEATAGRPGVDLLPDHWEAATDDVLERVGASKRPGDVVVVSIHWGSNWGHAIPQDQTRLAHALIDGGVDVIHGHSSHHPRPIEVHRGRLVLYGCGDFVNDYEGIRGHEEYRDELRLAYLADLDADTGELRDLRMIPLRALRMRLEQASDGDAEWLASTLDRTSRSFGTRVELDRRGALRLRQA